VHPLATKESNVTEREHITATQEQDTDSQQTVDSESNVEILEPEKTPKKERPLTLSGRPLQRRNLPAKTSSSNAVSRLDPLQRYFEELRRYPLLSREQEYELAVEFKETEDPELAYRLITANLRLVVKIAMEYQSAANNLLDLIQEGNVGLMQAVKKYDPFKEIRLSSYAQWWIRAYILKYLVNNARMVKIGTTQAQRKLFFNLRKEKERLELLGFKPEPALLAERLDVRESDVIEMEQRLSSGDVSLDTPVGDDSKSTIVDLVPAGGEDAEEKVMEQEFLAQFRNYMEEFAETLKDREKVIWEKRLASDEPMTLQEVGELFGVTRERARQIEKGISLRFRDYIRKQVPDLDAYEMISLA
jgi:RNA polymerase sigma-32 factor